jgi:hypothetical protein
MTGEQSFATAEKHSRVAVMHGLNFENGRRRKIVEKHTTFNFRLNDAAIYFISQIGVSVEHSDIRAIGYWLFGGGTRVLWPEAGSAVARRIRGFRSGAGCRDFGASRRNSSSAREHRGLQQAGAVSLRSG